MDKDVVVFYPLRKTIVIEDWRWVEDKTYDVWILASKRIVKPPTLVFLKYLFKALRGRFGELLFWSMFGAVFRP